MNGRQRQFGIALPAIIFMIVIVALLVGAMARILNVSSSATDIKLQSTRAFWAAKAGAEWAAYQINANPSGTCAVATGTLTVNGFQVAISCNNSDYNEASNTVRVFEVDVQAQSSGSPADLDYVSRRLRVVLNVEN